MIGEEQRAWRTKEEEELEEGEEQEEGGGGGRGGMWKTKGRNKRMGRCEREGEERKNGTG